MQSVQTQRDQVRSFFDRTDRYLAYRPNIVVRQEILRELLGEIRDADVLDLGCGDGSLSLPFLEGGCRVTAVDLSAQMLGRVRENTPPQLAERVTCIQSDLSALDAQPSYDLALCIGVLAYVGSVEAAVRRVADCLRPDGRCVLQLTDSGCLLGKLELGQAALRGRLSAERRFHMNRLSSTSVRECCRLAGLEVEREVRHWLVLPGTGRLPGRWLVAYDRAVRANRFLSRFAASAFLLCRKPGGARAGAAGSE